MNTVMIRKGIEIKIIISPLAKASGNSKKEMEVNYYSTS